LELRTVLLRACVAEIVLRAVWTRGGHLTLFTFYRLALRPAYPRPPPRKLRSGIAGAPVSLGSSGGTRALPRAVCEVGDGHHGLLVGVLIGRQPSCWLWDPRRKDHIRQDEVATLSAASGLQDIDAFENVPPSTCPAVLRRDRFKVRVPPGVKSKAWSGIE
jgi:hypothetical protein